MLYRVTHRTTYRYQAPVASSQHFVHLQPRALARQRCLTFELQCTPAARPSAVREDYFGNLVQCLEVLEEHHELVVSAVSLVDVLPGSGVRDGAAERQGLGAGPWEQCRDWLRGGGVPLEIQDFLHDSPLIRRQASLQELAAETFTPGRDLVDATIALNAWLHREFKFESGVTDVSTPLAEVLRSRKGVCQDFAHVAVGCLRSLGLAARYVSGYLETLPPPGMPRLVGADASHAWASVYVPSRGWFDFDPTTGLIPSERHVTIGWGRDFSDVTPIKGVILGGGSHTLLVGVDVEPLR